MVFPQDGHRSSKIIHHLLYEHLLEPNVFAHQLAYLVGLLYLGEGLLIVNLLQGLPSLCHSLPLHLFLLTLELLLQLTGLLLQALLVLFLSLVYFLLHLFELKFELENFFFVLHLHFLVGFYEHCFDFFLLLDSQHFLFLQLLLLGFGLLHNFLLLFFQLLHFLLLCVKFFLEFLHKFFLQLSLLFFELPLLLLDQSFLLLSLEPVRFFKSLLETLLRHLVVFFNFIFCILLANGGAGVGGDNILALSFSEVLQWIFKQEEHVWSKRYPV